MAEHDELTTADIANPNPSGPTDSAEETDSQHTATGEMDSSSVSEDDLGGQDTTGDAAQPSTTTAAAAAGADTAENATDEAAPLLSPDEAESFQGRWQSVQGDFVDQPREAVERADRLVADLMQRLAAQFSETRTSLEKQWEGQEDASTEDLRVAMTRYRSFFERLLSA